MKIVVSKRCLLPIVWITAMAATGCLTPQKIDKFVAKQYNDRLPKPAISPSATMAFHSAMPSGGTDISTTVHKTEKFLPLLVYWHVKESQNCTLNTAIAQATISTALNNASAQSLAQKLNGQKLDLTLEEAPVGFSLVNDSHAVWLIYAFSWSRVYVRPDTKDIVVSYKVLQSDSTFKTGKVTVRNTQQDKNFRFFQSWKSALSEYIQSYNSTLTIMSRLLISKLSEEL